LRVALIADIHGNLAACAAVLAEIEREGPEAIVCLGDVAATGPQPREVIALLRQLGCPMVMGNADVELLHPIVAAEEPDSDASRIADISRWGAAQLDESDRNFLASFQPTVSVNLAARVDLFCYHGSPRSYDDIIIATTPDDEVEAMIGGFAGRIFAGGHTHVRMLRGLPGREVLNPGSVGLAYAFEPDGQVRVPPWAEYALLSIDKDAISVDFRRVPYDRAATVEAMFEREMPHAAWWSADWR
jgi:predicted phosphodiesterase